MSVELVSRTLAHLTCLSTFLLFATTMSMAALNVAKLRGSPGCWDGRCTVTAAKPFKGPSFEGISGSTEVRTVAAVMLRQKT